MKWLSLRDQILLALEDEELNRQEVEERLIKRKTIAEAYLDQAKLINREINSLFSLHFIDKIVSSNEPDRYRINNDGRKLIYTCRIQKNKILSPCIPIKRASESDDVSGVDKGIGMVNSFDEDDGFYTRAVILKSGDWSDSDGIVINYCPFCGADISSHL